MDWLTPEMITALVAVTGAFGAVVKWGAQRREEQKAQVEGDTTRYVIPFLLGAQDLQSRLFNIARNFPQSTLSSVEERRTFATETLYLVAQYFFFESQLLSLTPFGRHARTVASIQDVRSAFSEAVDVHDRDAWCLFHINQRAWGQAVQPDEASAKPIPMTYLEFEDALVKGRFDPLGAAAIRESFDDPAGLQSRSTDRMATVQSRLVVVLDIVEGEVDDPPSWYRFRARRRHHRFTMSPVRVRLQADGLSRRH